MLNALAHDKYYLAKVRTIDVLREASNRLGICVDSVVIDDGRYATDFTSSHVVKLRSSTNHLQTVTISHDWFVNEEPFYRYAAPMIEEAVRKLSA